MTEFGKRLIESAKEALEIAKGTAKPGTHRITTYDECGKPRIIADFSKEVLAEIEAEIAAERQASETPPELEQHGESKVSNEDSATFKPLKQSASLKKTGS
jgi:hypothetical protein